MSALPDGAYEFTGLCAGTYTVEYDPNTVPGQAQRTFCNVGSNRAIDSNCSPATVDFGFLPH